MKEFTEQDFELTDYEVSTNEIKLKCVMAYLNTIQEPNDVLNDPRAIKCYNYIKSLVSYMFFYDFNDKWSYFNEHYCTLTTKLIDHFASVIESLLPPVENTSEMNQIKLNLLWTIISALQYLVPKSIKLRVEFLNKQLFRGLFGLLNTNKFIDYYTNQDKEYLGNIILIINWLSKSADMNKETWSQVNSSRSLLKFGRTCHAHRLISFLAFSNIANDKEIDSESDVHSIIPELTKYLKQGADEISSYATKYEEMEFLEDDEKEAKQYYVHHVYAAEYYFTLTLTGIILGIYKIAVNNNIKFDLYQQPHMKETIHSLISKGSDIEQKYALKLLAQLCFDARVCDLVLKDKDLLTLIETLKKSTNTNIKSTPKICEQILWTLKQKSEPTELINNSTVINNNNNRQIQLMISYNSASRDLCLKIKDELEKSGYRVWIDVSEIHGSSLDAMAKAVETSDFILMCVTEKYRQSLNCQAEAQYAFKLNKKIIPLVMQSGYENADGWMGIIMGDKIYVNFTKYSFEECIRRLVHETGLATAKANNTSNAPQTQYKAVNVSQTGALLNKDEKQNAVDWSSDDVNKWFMDNSLSQSILNALSPCDGQLLAQVHDLKKSAPEFFYQTISTSNNKSIPIRDILLFTLKLKNLFE